ncbi:MAG TPA: hypothetical protein VLX90_13930 [Steroidobacteraceae bacterium]|nr:hypothetical protein [Steroidobacteraceae bacterium]
MKEERLIGNDQELIKSEAAGRRLGYAGREAVDVVGYFVNASLHIRSFERWSCKSIMQPYYSVRPDSPQGLDITAGL